MLDNYNTYKLLKVFLDNPTESFRLRELGRLSKISPASVIKYLFDFEKKNLIEKYEKRGIFFYRALRENSNFVLYKKISILYELNNSGLVDYLWEKLSPEAIILYGSYSRGESIENSDIDIFVVGKICEGDISKFEKILNKKIHLMCEINKKIPNELKNNLINGILLKGYFKVV
jgi:predicted nucleotidyltransferase